MQKRTIATYLGNIPVLQLCHEVSELKELENMLRIENPDILFIVNPNGLVEKVFTTCNMFNIKHIVISDNLKDAVKAFEYDAIDFVLNPCTPRRLKEAVNKYRKRRHEQDHLHRTDNVADPAMDFIFIRAHNRYERIEKEQIIFVKGLREYLMIYLNDRKLITYMSFNKLGSILDDDRFLRIHKSFVINLRRISHIDGNSVKIGDHWIPIGRSYREIFYDKLRVLKMIV